MMAWVYTNVKTYFLPFAVHVYMLLYSVRCTTINDYNNYILYTRTCINNLKHGSIG